jgi:hypothetical protein
MLGFKKMIVKNRIENIVIVFIMLSVFFQNSPANAESNLSFEQELIEKVHEYYDLEKIGDWKRTYAFRTPLYRKSVVVELYKKKMRRDNAGWKLIAFRIIKKAVEGNYAALKIKFIEQVPDGYFQNNIKKTIKITEISTWERIDGNWFCRDACSRRHLSMNGDLVMRKDQVPIDLLKKEKNSDISIE